METTLWGGLARSQRCLSLVHLQMSKYIYDLTMHWLSATAGEEYTIPLALFNTHTTCWLMHIIHIRLLSSLAFTREAKDAPAVAHIICVSLARLKHPRNSQEMIFSDLSKRIRCMLPNGASLPNPSLALKRLLCVYRIVDRTRFRLLSIFVSRNHRQYEGLFRQVP